MDFLSHSGTTALERNTRTYRARASFSHQYSRNGLDRPGQPRVITLVPPLAIEVLHQASRFESGCLQLISLPSDQSQERSTLTS